MLLAGLAVLVGLGGCPRGPAPPAGEPRDTVSREAAPGAVDGAVVHAIDAAASRVAIEVYRGGPLARLGHNHVITASGVSGRVWLTPDLDTSAFELTVPVRRLVVDDEAARREAGADFPPGVPDADKAATRVNLLGPAVLDAERYPRVRVHSVAIAGVPPRLRITAALTLRDVTREIEAPVTTELDATAIRVGGEFVLRQSDFGITPFSVAFGALSVQDEVRIRFALVARRQVESG